MNTRLPTRFKLLSGLTVCVALLTACGGGGSDNALNPAGIADDGSSTSSTSNLPTTPTTPPAPTSPGQPSTAGTSDSCDIPNFQSDMLRAVNEARAQARSCGGNSKPAVAAITWNDLLFKASAGHSKDMAQRNYFAHNTPEGVDPFQRMTNAGYKYGYAGENIAAGQNGIASVMSSWLGSPDHCSAIMSSNFKEAGVACVKNAKGKPYWTMGLASPR